MFTNILCTMIEEYSEPNVSKLSDLTGKFNSVGQGKILLVLNEVSDIKASSNKDMEEMKTIISDRVSRVEEKYVKKKTGENTMNIIIVTNNSAPVAITPNDRRYLVVTVSPKFKGNKSFFDALSAACTEEFYSELLTYYLSIDVSGFVPEDIPWTQEKIDLAKATMSPIDQVCTTLLSRLTSPEGVRCSDVRSRLPDEYKSEEACGLVMKDRCIRKRVRDEDTNNLEWTYVLKPEYASCLKRLM